VIPRAHVTAWRRSAPWPTDAQVEQDLVLSRALVEMFQDQAVSRVAMFRGGTALHKLFLEKPGRYSEDIDLIQVEPGPIGPLLGAIRAVLDRWLGKPGSKRGSDRVSLLYRFETTSRPIQPMRLKLEINTREHVCMMGRSARRFEVSNPWFSDSTDVPTFLIEEILATKLRALYQRKKGRDLYDLWLALSRLKIDDEKVVECFVRYMEAAGARVSRAEFEANLSEKLESPSFLGDLAPLLPTGVIFDAPTGGDLLQRRILARLPGDPWKGRPA